MAHFRDSSCEGEGWSVASRVSIHGNNDAVALQLPCRCVVRGGLPLRAGSLGNDPRCRRSVMIRMLQALHSKLSYSNVVASLALFVALGGTGYAALSLPRDSVGT